MAFVAPSYGGISGAQERTLYGTIGGVYAPVPYLDDVSPAQLVVDTTGWSGPIRISAINDDILYCFAQNSTDVMVGLPGVTLGTGDYKLDMTVLVPDVIGDGTSVRELIPAGYPFLLLKSRAAAAAGTSPEVRIRRA